MENNNIDTKYFKDKLLKEKDRLVSELKSVGRINPDNPLDWEPIPGELEENTSDKNDQADNIEQYEKNTAILKELEIELNEVNHALEKIEKGTYGICEKTGNPISRERLEAYPAARENI
ncbi:MAG TPA: TraR/DksA C4-type zinc finger protein [Candidatus Paceibacterota bacterium]|nr:TraR/DksA C4-type zinc finger protein [Candidatus Paceibacterota bacterium]